VKGISIISHGKSSPRAIKNAIKVGVKAIDTHMDEHIGRRLEQEADGNGAATARGGAE
jgi:glycerol-3-phosphate acyltransferase PlsX